MFVEVTRYLLRLPECCDLFILSERFSQDKIENFFERNELEVDETENPSAKEMIDSPASVSIQGSSSRSAKGGNSRGNQKRPLLEINNAPIPKRHQREEQKEKLYLFGNSSELRKLLRLVILTDLASLYKLSKKAAIANRLNLSQQRQNLSFSSIADDTESY